MTFRLRFQNFLVLLLLLRQCSYNAPSTGQGLNGVLLPKVFYLCIKRLNKAKIKRKLLSQRICLICMSMEFVSSKVK